MQLKPLVGSALLLSLAAACGPKGESVSTSSTFTHSTSSEESRATSEDVLAYNPGLALEAPKGPAADCARPEIFQRPGESISLRELQAEYWGKYEVEAVHVYHSSSTADGKDVGSFYSRARRVAGEKSIYGTKAVRETRLSMLCRRSTSRYGVSFLSGVTVPLASVVHLPSMRITVYDKQSGYYDSPTFNYPTIVDFFADSTGQMSFLNFPAGKVVGPPYLTNLHLADVMAMQNDPKIHRGAGAGFEIRYVLKGEHEPVAGNKFQVTTEVVVVYKQSGNL